MSGLGRGFLTCRHRISARKPTKTTAAAPPIVASPLTGDAPPAAEDVCAVDKRAFYQCLETSNGDASRCQELFNNLSMCQENAKWQSA